MDAVGVADEVVVEHEVVLVAGELPDADLAHPAEADLLHLDAPGVAAVADRGGEAPRAGLVSSLQRSRGLADLAWTRRG